jgi:endonuclease/exonuclease/phosphatase family metal-dependent hydrolase
VFDRGRRFRYICTHPEEETAPQIQVLQARELLGGPANVNMPVMICGDFNSDPLHRDGSLAYDSYTTAGFKDAWAVLHPLQPAGGLTWGHDEFLADPSQQFDRRIDLVFYKGAPFLPARAEVIDLRLDTTQPPLWASDHAAVHAAFLLK